MLLHEEWDWLRYTVLAEATTRFEMTPKERVLLYLSAIQTGLRSNELRSLTRGRLFLDLTPPFITCKARSTKDAKDARQYIQPTLAEELKNHIAVKAPKAPVFNMPNRYEAAKMFRADLSDARRAWQKATKNDPQERLGREQGDFLADVNQRRRSAGLPQPETHLRSLPGIGRQSP